ncbi:MAG TPA: glycoside hydrolase family 3 N-terminal domain-containing protein [Streptosporangiaceae bacterium]|nr:glycoside hydrolase family 3 N-terminal domain-containing protein [Streptosporangiaceae bacterium]
MFPVRGKKLIILITGIVLAVAAIVVFTADAAARRGADPHRNVTTTAQSTPSRSDQVRARSGSHGQVRTPARSSGQAGRRLASVGLRRGAVSPSAAGLATAAATLPKLSPAQLAGQRVIYSYKGLNPPSALLTLIRHGEVAGIIFFSDNIGSHAHIAAVVRELQQANAAKTNPVRLPLLLMTDQEGGEVKRLSGAPTLSAKEMGESSTPSTTTTREGRLGGKNLRSVGINVNLAPVLDVFRQPGNFIDEFQRSFGSNPAKVSKLGTLFTTAEQAQGVAGTVKHFPGLGAAARPQNTDERPVTLRLALSTIRDIDELPYKSAIAAKVKLVMVSWAIYPALDAKLPAGLSPTIVQGELRKRLGFAGVTITDALEAGALRSFGSTAHRSTLAARAGMDLLLDAEQNYRQGQASMNALESDYLHNTLNGTAFKAAVSRILALRASLPQH